MKNPLRKRIKKELVQEAGKYIVIFLFMLATIGFVSGFLVADNSMTAAYDTGFSKYHIEDGNFELEEKAGEKTVDVIENEDVTLYENYYTEKDAKDSSTLRVFANRDKVNLPCVMEGKLPAKKGEIAVDRLYAEYKKIKVGDEIPVGQEDLKVTGLVALSDYSALFQSNADTMFDASHFGVAVVTKEQLDTYDDLHYSYSWVNKDQSMTDKEKKDFSKDLMETIAKRAPITNFIPEQDNQAIHFTGDDMGSDKAMMTTLLYIIIVILAFIFGVTIRNTVEKESGVIGTLRASGYTKAELIRHYLTLPVIVTLVAAALGNVLGYTLMKKVVVSMYYHSYCLPTYETLWNVDAFILTTVIPVVIMFIVNLAVLVTKLSLSPLKFLRHDLNRKQKKRVMRLPNFSFMHRFRLRVITQNIPNYLMILIGMLFANVLMMFGLMMTPLFDHYGDNVTAGMISEYQYVLKTPMETNNLEAEKFCMESLVNRSGNSLDEMMIYGVKNDSKYVKNLDFSSDKKEVYVSEGILEKYDMKIGDTLKLKDKFSGDPYDFKIKGTVNYPASLAVFMNENSFRGTFDWKSDEFTGYFADSDIMDIPKQAVASVITKNDLMKLVNQMKSSMGSLFPLITVFAISMSVLIIYLLSKIVIEKNGMAISMVKILGYNNGEVSRLYIMSTSIVVVLSLLLALPISYAVIALIYKQLMSSFAGWISLYIGPMTYVKMFAYGLISYILVAILQFRKIKKVPMEDVLKNVD